MLKDNFSILNSNEFSLKQDIIVNRTKIWKKKKLFEVIQF